MTILKPTGEEWRDRREAGQPDTQEARFALSDYAEEWHFFNHGVFFSYAEFNYPHEDPVADWYEDQPIGTELMLQPFGRTLIEGMALIPGLGKVTWGNVVCGIRKELWPSLFMFLGGACSVNRKEKRFYQPFSGDVQMLDPVLVERHSILKPDIPTITVTVFCVDGNEQRVEVRPPTSPTAPLRMVVLPARPEVQLLTRAVLSGDFTGLSAHANPAFQQQLDQYNQLSGKDVTDAISHRLTDEHGRELGAS